MLELSKRDVHRLSAEAEKAVSEMQQGKTVRDVLTDMYIAGLPDKTESQGMVMADRVIETVAEYTKACEEAMQDPERWIDESLDQFLCDKEPSERCELLYQMVKALTAVNAAALDRHMRDADVSVDSMIAEMGDLTLDSAAITPELEEQLRNEVRQALENSDVFAGRMESFADLLEQMDESEGVAHLIVDYGVRSADYKAVAAMMAYIAAKQGTLEGVAQDVTLDEITLGVCAAMETERVAVQVENGEIAENVAATIIKVLGFVAEFYLLIHIATLPVVLMTALIPNVFGLVTGAILGFATAYALADVLTRVTDKVTDVAASLTIVTARAVISGLRKLASWAWNSAVPAIVAAVKTGVAFLADLMHRGVSRADVRQTETVTQRA